MKETLGPSSSDLSQNVGSEVSTTLLNQHLSQLGSSLGSELSKELSKALTINQLKLRVLEYLSPFQKLGTFHWLSDELGLLKEISELPVLVHCEEKTFGKDRYSILSIRFDSFHVQENNLFWDLDELKAGRMLYSGNVYGDGDEFRLTADSESRQESNHNYFDYTASERSQDSMKQAQQRMQKKMQATSTNNQTAATQVPFDKLLLKSKH